MAFINDGGFVPFSLRAFSISYLYFFFLKHQPIPLTFIALIFPFYPPK